MAATHHEQLRDLRAQAVEVTEAIHQTGDSPDGGRGAMQQKVLVQLRSHGPDLRLQTIERTLESLIKLIDDYLMPDTD